MIRVFLILFLIFLPIIFTLFIIRYSVYILFKPIEARRLIISLDQLANTVLNGNMDETISSRSGRHCPEFGGTEEDREKWACILCKVLDVFDKDHCKKSIGT